MNPWWICALLLVLLVYQQIRFSGFIKKIYRTVHTIVVGRERPSFIQIGPWMVRRTIADLELLLERLNESERKLAIDDFNLRGILSSMTEGVFVTNATGHIIMANEQMLRMFGISKLPLHQSVIEATGNHQVNHALREVLQHRKSGRWQITLASGDSNPGKSLHVVLTISAVLSLNKELLGAVAVLHDVTALKQMELVQKEFVANTSHELRTPLAIFRGYLEELIEAPPPSKKELIRILKLIQAQTDRLNNLIQDLLTLSLFESRKITLRKEIVPLSKLVEETLEELCRVESLRDWRITLKSRIAEDLDKAWVDITRIKQVLANLVENAVKYSPQSKDIQVELDPIEGTNMNRISVIDKGIGISSEDLPFVFDRFFRANKGRARSTGGTGLGLSIVKQIVEAHGGSVGISSRQGLGTTIWFSLPQNPRSVSGEKVDNQDDC